MVLIRWFANYSGHSSPPFALFRSMLGKGVNNSNFPSRNQAWNCPPSFSDPLPVGCFRLKRLKSPRWIKITVFGGDGVLSQARGDLVACSTRNRWQHSVGFKNTTKSFVSALFVFVGVSLHPPSTFLLNENLVRKGLVAASLSV